MEVKNLFINFKDGSSALVYTYDLTEEEVKQWAEKALKKPVIEVYHVPQDQLQYYCIDERYWGDTPEVVAAVRKMLAA